MAIEDEVRSLDARVAKLTAALNKTMNAQIEASEWSAETQSDIGYLVAEMHDLSGRIDKLVAATLRLTGLLDTREEMKTTLTYPIAAGAYDEEIIAMCAANATDSDIARALGCNPSTVSRRRQAIGAEAAKKRLRWTSDEDKRLRALASRCSTWHEVAEEMDGRTPESCKVRARRIGLVLRPAGRPWTEVEDEFLRRVWESGEKDIHQICHELKRTSGAVYERTRALGLTKSRKRLHWASERSMREFWSKEDEAA